MTNGQHDEGAIPSPTEVPRAKRPRKLWFAMCALGAICAISIIAVRVLGLMHPFSIPSGSMSPALSPGDHIMMEGFTLLVRKPRCGEIIVFRTDGIPGLPDGQYWTMRVAGVPRDHIRIEGGTLYINDAATVLSNSAGKITYDLPPIPEIVVPYTNTTVPPASYYVLGDNSTNSNDSRFWGTVPAKNIKRHVWFCYSPPSRIGAVK